MYCQHCIDGEATQVRKLGRREFRLCEDCIASIGPHGWPSMTRVGTVDELCSIHSVCASTPRPPTQNERERMAASVAVDNSTGLLTLAWVRP